MPNAPVTLTESNNNKMSKLFSVEVIGSMFAVTFAIGVSYSTLASSQAAQDAKIQNIEAQQHDISAAVTKIQTDTAVIRNEQAHLSEKLEEHHKDIKKIIEILREHDKK